MIELLLLVFVHYFKLRIDDIAIGFLGSFGFFFVGRWPSVRARA